MIAAIFDVDSEKSFMLRLVQMLTLSSRFTAVMLGLLVVEASAIKVDSVLNLYSLYGTDRTVLMAHFQTFRGSGRVGSNHVVSNNDPSDAQSGDGIFGWDVTAGDSIVLDGAYSGSALRPFLAATISVDANGATFDSMKFTRSMIDGSHNGGHQNTYRGGLVGAPGSAVVWKGWNNLVGPAKTKVMPDPAFVLPVDGGNLAYTGPALPAPPNNLVLPDTAINFATFDWSVCPDYTTPGLPGMGSRVHIPPGCYGKITIKYLDTLIIDEGTYIVRDMSMLETGGTASLLASQPKGKRTLLICANSWKQGNGSATILRDSHGADSALVNATMNIGPLNEAMGQVMILYKGTQPMSIGTGTHITATISAPNSELNLKDITALYGQAFAKRLIIRTGFNANLGQYIPYYEDPPKVTLTITQLSTTVREPDTLATGKPDTAVAKFLLNMDHVNGLAVTVWFHTQMTGPADSPGVALEGADYVNILKGSVRIPVNGLADTLRVKVLGDVWYEGDRTFKVVIDSIWNGQIDTLTQVAVGTILENDLPPVFRVEDGSTTEGKPLKFRVHLVQVPSRGGAAVPSASARVVRYKWRVVPQNPLLIPDWDTAAKIWRVDTLSPRTSDTVISIPTFADGIFQQAETLMVQIDWVFGATTLLDSGARVLARGIILDSDGPPVLAVVDTSVAEGPDSTGFAMVRVRILSAATGKPAKLARPFSFSWATSDLTAKDGKHYRRASGTVVFTRIGATDTLLPVRLLGDRRHDVSRQFRVTLSAATGAALVGTYAKPLGPVTIADDDPAPKAVAQTITHARSLSDTLWRFAISLSDSSRTTSVLHWRTTDGSARAGFDFVGDSGTIVMRPQQTDTAVWITIKGLALWHSDRSFHLELAAVSDLSATTNGTGVIQAAVAPPVLVLDPGTVWEGRSGDTAVLKIPFRLVDKSGKPTTSLDTASFDWSTLAGKALDTPDPTFGLTDFVRVLNAHAVLAAGRTGDTLRVKVIGNGLHQLDRTFTAFGTPRYGVSGVTGGTLTILDDDAAPRLVVDSVVRFRDGTKSVPFPFRAHLIGLSGKDTVSGVPVSFTWATRDGSATVALRDYQNVPGRSEILSPNTFERFLTVTVLPDARYAPDLDFFIDLARLTGVTRTVRDSVGRGLIRCGVTAPRIRVTGGITTEAKDGDTTLIPFRVDLVDSNGTSMATRLAIPFVWSTQDSTALKNVDYLPVVGAPDTIRAFTSGTVVYVAVPGHSRHNVPLRYLKATVTPKAGLFTPQGSWLTGVGTIRNNRLAPRASINSVTVNEPLRGQIATGRFTVTLNEPSALVSRVRVSLEDSTALAGTNYLLFGTGLRDTVIEIPPLATQATLGVRVIADDIFDTARVFVARLSRVDQDASVATVPGIGRIVNSDAPPTASITDTVWVRERTIGDNTALFTVTLSRRSAFPVRIPFATQDGTAKAGLNFVAVSGVLTFVPAGALHQGILVAVHNDGIFSTAPLDFVVALGASVDSVRIPKPRGVGMILEGNKQPELAGDTLVVSKRDTVTHFVLHLSAPLGQPDTVTFATQDGTARAGRDYQATTGRLILVPNQVDFQIPVHILNPVNWYSKPREFRLLLSETDTVTIVTPMVPAFIVDRGALPAVDIADADSVLEGDPARFRLTLPGPSDDTVRVVVATRDVTAKAGTHYLARSADTLVFLPNRTSLSYAVQTRDDSLFDTALSFQVRIERVMGAQVGRNPGTGWILEAGPEPFAVWTKLRDTVREDVRPDVVVFPVRLSRLVAFPFQLPVRLDTLVVPELNRARSVNFALLDAVVRFPAATLTVDWKIRVLRDGINAEPKTLPMVLQPSRWVATGPDTLAVLVIRDVDSLPTLEFVDSLLDIRQRDTTLSLRVRLRPRSGRPVDAPFAVSGTARYGIEHLLRDGKTPTILPGDSLANILVNVVDDHRYGPDRRLVVRLGETNTATLGRDSVVIWIRESSLRPVMEFDTSKLVVRDNAGSVAVRVVQSIASDSVTTAAVGLDSASRLVWGIGLVPDTLIAVRIDTGATGFGFQVKIANNGVVGPDRVIRLHLRDVFAAALGPDSILEITIVNTNLPPLVVIQSPSHKPLQPQDTLTNRTQMLVKWTLQQGHDLAYGPQVSQPDTIFTLEEGLNILRRRFVDSAGNEGSDSVRVLADFTPPQVEVYKIVVPQSGDSTRSQDVVGKRAATRFGRDTICYTVRDSAKGIDGVWRVKVDSFRVAVDLHGDSTFRIPVRACDVAGNCGADTATIQLKQSRPLVQFQNPSPGDRVVSGTGPVAWTVTDVGRTTVRRDQEVYPNPGYHTITRCAEDSVGNRGCASVTVWVQPVSAERSSYLDLDHDGRVDAALVELDGPWASDSLPQFDFTLNGQTRKAQSPDSAHLYATLGSRGTLLLDGGKPVLDLRGDSIWVAVGQLLYGSDGKVRVVDGWPQTTILGDTVKNADGSARRDASGRLLWRVPGPGQIDRTRLLVPIVPPFAYGATGFDTDQQATLRARLVYRNAKGGDSTVDFLDDFKVGDRVPPVVLSAQIHRTEFYTGTDTLIIVPSEPLIPNAEWVEILKGGRWVRVPSDSVTIDVLGRLVIRLPPGDSASPRPGIQLRFVSGVGDELGNRVAAPAWTVVVSGAPRPPVVQVVIPKAVIKLTPSERDRQAPGGIVIRASTSRSEATPTTFEWWKSGVGYHTAADAETRSICPQPDQCNGPILYMNRPARLLVYVYDNAGTFVMKFEQSFSEADLDPNSPQALQPDKLDRYRLQLAWNHRDLKGDLVASGVYFWRIVSYVRDKGQATPIMTNRLAKIGVEIHQSAGIW